MTTTDIARMTSTAVATLSTSSDALDRLGQWVTAAAQARQLVAGLVHTAFIPDSYRVKLDPRATPDQRAEAERVVIGNATAAVLQGITLGIDPMTALQQIYVVHGRPGMYAQMMVALVTAHGHDVWTEDLTDTRAVVCGRRRGAENVERSTVTMDMARKAGWTSNQAYTKTPQDMLYARAAARLCKRIAPEVLLGIASVEEMQDEIRTTAEVGPRTVRPRSKPAAIEASEEPALPDTAPADPPFEADPPAERMITQAQQRKLHALLRDLNMADRDVAFVHIAGILDREVQSTKDLTLDDARQVIDALDAEVAALPTAGEPELDLDSDA